MSIQQKKIASFVGVGVIIISIAVGVYFGFLKKAPVPAEQSQQSQQQEEQTVVPTIAPNDLGLSFVARTDGKAVKFSVKNPAGIQSIDYEISYLAAGDIPRGVIGHIDVKSSDNIVSTNYIDLGTCSSGVCKYDQGVTSVKLVLKIVKDDGKNYSTEQTLSL